MSDPDMFRPPVNRAMKVLDRSFFKTTVRTSAARIHKTQDVGIARSALIKSQDLLQWNGPNIKLDPDEARARTGCKCLLLKPNIKYDDPTTWSATLQELQDNGKIGLIPYTLELGYDDWSYDDIIKAIIPEEEHHAAPAGFAPVGHVAHLNLRAAYLPYKTIIAEVIRDKSHSIRTVINKVDPLGHEENEFRTFRYEVLAGEDDLDVETKHQDCVFRFNFGKVYWNPRLHHEHERLLDLFKPGEAVCDVMAGIGPFAVPSGKRRVFAFANDLNPESYRYMKDAIKTNKVEEFVRPFNEDGHEFIRTSAYQLAHEKQVVRICAKKGRPPKVLETLERPHTFSHYVMNLPGSAIDFLPSYVGLYSQPLYADSPPEGKPHLPRDPRKLFEPFTSTPLPTVHVYCFCSEDDDEAARLDICKRISEKLQWEMTPDYEHLVITDVRRVSTHKRDFCASFRLPPEVAFRGLEI